MTTIVYRDGIIACDSQITGMFGRCGNIRKIARSSDGIIGGAAGRFEDVAQFLEWVEGGLSNEVIQTNGDFEGLVISQDGQVAYIGQNFKQCAVEAPFVALGSGEAYAMGAMAMGASAADAVRAAIAFDVNSGGEVKILELKS